ncbi:MAG: metallophosphoesterase family protein [Desulfurivibrionaceae bacterium]
MTARIGIFSDVHATPGPAKEALAIFRAEKVAMTLCAGDLAGYGDELEETVELLKESGCEIIRGNHDAWYLDDHSGQGETPVTRFLRRLPLSREFTIEGKRIYMVHGSPGQPLTGGIRLLDERGVILPELRARWRKELEEFPADVLIVSHTHQLFAEKLGHPLVINPGSTKFNHSCGILSLPDLTCEIRSLSGKTPLKSWNWEIYRRNG